MKVIIDDQITELTPEIMAEQFWNMGSGDQAKFYNHLDQISDFRFPFQLQYITEEHGLTLAGRRVMQMIGDYSHWGITSKIIKDEK